MTEQDSIKIVESPEEITRDAGTLEVIEQAYDEESEEDEGVEGEFDKAYEIAKKFEITAMRV